MSVKHNWTYETINDKKRAGLGAKARLEHFSEQMDSHLKWASSFSSLFYIEAKVYSFQLLSTQ